MYWKYLKYVIRHKWYVFIECCKFGQIWRGITHDLSKFLPDEFIPYAKYFYGEYPNWDDGKICLLGYKYKNTKEGISKAFDIAWLKHQHRNKHHWQYNILREDDGNTKILDMKLCYIYEMVADWKGAGRCLSKINDPDECKKWYTRNYNKILFSENTREIVNKILIL